MFCSVFHLHHTLHFENCPLRVQYANGLTIGLSTSILNDLPSLKLVWSRSLVQMKHLKQTRWNHPAFATIFSASKTRPVHRGHLDESPDGAGNRPMSVGPTDRALALLANLYGTTVVKLINPLWS